MDFTHGTGRSSRRRYPRCLPWGVACGLMAFMTILVAGLVSYIDHGKVVDWVEGDSRVPREVPEPEYPASLDIGEQLAMANEDAPEDLFIQEGQVHARSDDPARRYAGPEQVGERDTGEDEVPGAEERRRQFKLPKLPIPSKILDLPTLIPTKVKDILTDLPVVPTIPTDPGDIIDDLPTDPGELISDIPIPSLPTIPVIPTLPVPVPIPTDLPRIPLPTDGKDIPHVPLPTVLPPGKPGDPGDTPKKLPDLTEIPHRVINLLHDAISKLSADPNTPKFLRDILRLILRIINRIGGGDPVPKPKPPKTTLPLPVPTLPPLPRPTLTLARRYDGEEVDGPVTHGAKTVRDEEGGGDKEPLSDEQRKQLRKSVADEVWAESDWSNPVVAAITAGWAMLTFDAVYLVAEKFKETDDEAEKQRMLELFVVVDDEELDAAAAAA